MTKSKTPVVNLPYSPHEFPSIKIGTAIQNQSSKEICFVVGGGIGDRVCAEPTLRFAIQHFKDCNISLICETPELFSHLSFKEVFDMKRTFPIIGRHLYLNTYPKSRLLNEFLNANLTHCVDYPSMASIRIQLPEKHKFVLMDAPSPGLDIVRLKGPHYIIVHPGKSWPSRTFPSAWWDSVIYTIKKRGYQAVIVGSDTVQLAEHSLKDSIDLRGKTTLMEFAWILQHCEAVITNDSSPVHLAAPGRAKIAFVSSCRRGDLLLHWRKSPYAHESGGLGWRMKDFAKTSVWDKYPLAPNILDEVHIDKLPAGVSIQDILPQPEEILDWINKETA